MKSSTGRLHCVEHYMRHRFLCIFLPIEWELSNKLLPKCHCEGSSNHVCFMSLQDVCFMSLPIMFVSYCCKIMASHESVSPCMSGHLSSKQSGRRGELPQSLPIVMVLLPAVLHECPELVCGVAAVHFLVGHRYHAKSLVSQAVTFLPLSTGWVLFLCVEFHDGPFILDVLWNTKFPAEFFFICSVAFNFPIFLPPLLLFTHSSFFENVTSVVLATGQTKINDTIPKLKELLSLFFQVQKSMWSTLLSSFSPLS